MVNIFMNMLLAINGVEVDLLLYTHAVQAGVYFVSGNSSGSTGSDANMGVPWTFYSHRQRTVAAVKKKHWALAAPSGEASGARFSPVLDDERDRHLHVSPSRLLPLCVCAREVMPSNQLFRPTAVLL